MSLWPDTLNIGPIREWPGALTTARKYSPFAATLTTTLKELDREIRGVTDTRAQRDSAELLIAIEPGGFRMDGRPRKDAKTSHPGVILSIDSRHGHLSYPCDTFNRWEDNLRAIVLSLESLRRVDRYGVTTHGEQYRGFLALEAGTGERAWSVAEAQRALARVLGYPDEPAPAASDLRLLVRRAKAAAHPDRGGIPTHWETVMEAERVLTRAGLL